MNKLSHLISIALLALLALTSCSQDSEDGIQTALQNDYQVLTSAPHGWVMQYFPSSDDTHGGYTVLLRFDTDGQVHVSSDVDAQTRTCQYTLGSDHGIVLQLGAQEGLMSLFAEAIAAQVGDQTAPQLYGDADFEIISASDNYVGLRGRQTGTSVVLHPMQDDWTTMVSRIAQVQEGMTRPRYFIQIDDLTVDVAMQSGSLVFTYPDQGETVRQTIPYTFTPRGLLLSRPLTVGGRDITGFFYEPDVYAYEAMNASSLLLQVNLCDLLVPNAWFFDKELISPKAYPYFDLAKQGCAYEDEILYLMFLGPASKIGQFQTRGYDDSYALTFISGAYAGALHFDMTPAGPNTVEMRFTGEHQGDGNYYYVNCNFNSLISMFCTVAGGRYRLSVDDPKYPTILYMTNEQDPELNWGLRYEYKMRPLGD